MAKDDAEPEEDEEEEEGGGGKKKIIMIVVALAGAGAAYQFMLKPSPPPEEMASAAPPESTVTTMAAGEIIELEEMILNVGNTETTGYLRIGLAIQLDEATMPADFEPELAIAKDVAVQYLSAQDADMLRSPEGRVTAKEELTTLIREAYGNEKVFRVLFTSFVMQ